MPEFDVLLEIRDNLALATVVVVNLLAVYKLIRPLRSPFEIQYYRIPEPVAPADDHDEALHDGIHDSIGMNDRTDAWLHYRRS